MHCGRLVHFSWERICRSAATQSCFASLTTRFRYALPVVVKCKAPITTRVCKARGALDVAIHRKVERPPRKTAGGVGSAKDGVKQPKGRPSGGSIFQDFGQLASLCRQQQQNYVQRSAQKGGDAEPRGVVGLRPGIHGNRMSGIQAGTFSQRRSSADCPCGDVVPALERHRGRCVNGAVDGLDAVACTGTEEAKLSSPTFTVRRFESAPLRGQGAAEKRIGPRVVSSEAMNASWAKFVGF